MRLFCEKNHEITEFAFFLVEYAYHIEQIVGIMLISDEKRS